jgi:hypothetical protein
MPTESKITLGTIFSGINALATVGAVVGGVMVIGQRDAQLAQARNDIGELKSIVERIAQVQASMVTVDGVQGERINTLNEDIRDIHIRLDRLDRRTL